MLYFGIKTYAPVASFRIPETHTFQQTLPLPPITTLIGILGAAAGFSFQKAIGYFTENEIYFGVIGKHRGKTKDLWKYRKIKAGESVTAVLLKEYLIDLDMTIYIVCKDLTLAQEIRNYFLNPYYVLTAGNSDSLLKIKEVTNITEIDLRKLYEFENTVLPGDHAVNFESKIDLKTVPLMREIYAPQVHLLPTMFDFKGDERRVKNRQPFTFVDTPIRLKEPIFGFEENNKAVALL
ncbi:MAG: CRISPR-associated protein Cas5t [Clostridia bacterium]|nr:CRISPR-associated protein Cas5t [Clostridia bacterium]MDN5322627.1 CRISPR-associated protein Cas5t [Clostridia bacterium]